MPRGRSRAVLVGVLAAALLGGASGTAVGEAKQFVEFEGEEFPALAPLGPVPVPKDNPQKVDEKGIPVMDDPKVQLGKLLFFDARLSGDSSVACSTCHSPEEGWGLNTAISRGYPGTSHWRNSHTVINSAYMGKLFWDGSALSLEVQAPSAAQGLSGNGKADMMEERLRQIPEYRRRFRDIFGSEWPELKDAYRAIAAFQRALVQTDTPFDRYLRGETDALSEEQVRGLELFQGKAGCIQCHNGPMFSDEKYYNLGVPLQESFLEDPIQQITHRFEYFSKGVPEEIYRTAKIDVGLYFVTHRKTDMGKFRVQPLRYLEFTPPYMHNGVFDDLEEVVDFYDRGGDDDPVEWNFGFSTKTERMKKLNLTDQEKEDLVSFLDSLSGEEILMEQPVLPDDEPMPWVAKE
jgi:cytochrome c peroxidase